MAQTNAQMEQQEIQQLESQMPGARRPTARPRGAKKPAMPKGAKHAKVSRNGAVHLHQSPGRGAPQPIPLNY